MSRRSTWAPLALNLCLVLLLASPAYATISGSAGLDTTNYVSTAQSSKGVDFSNLRADVLAETTSKTIRARAQAEFMLGLTKNSTTTGEAPEIYIGMNPETFPVQLSLGRKLMPWNVLDNEWGLGIWQPRFRWDVLHPEEVGMMGAFLEAQSEFVQGAIFITPFFVPDRGVPIDASNGNIRSSSPWMITPPNNVFFRGQSIPIAYDLRVPPVEDVVMNGGWSTNLRVGHKSGRGPWVSTSFSRKPVNQLLLGFFGKMSIDANAPADVVDPIQAKLYPRILYHELKSFDMGYSHKRVNLWASALWEHPIRDETPATWNTQEITNSEAYGFGVRWAAVGELDKRGMEFSLGYLRQVGGDAPSQGPPELNVSNFESRYPFKSTLRFGYETPVNLIMQPISRGHFWEKLRWKMNLTYDFIAEGSIVSTELDYRPSQKWIIRAGVDILSSSNPDANTSSASDLINRYVANDAIYGRVGYVF
ncbi:hypothetical protein K2X30_05400 [bacterium]|nr:hypothetical protein [bacterium]